MSVGALRIWHNPRCSKSRQTLQLIRDQGLEPIIIEYLRTPPTVTELRDALKALDLRPRELIRTKERIYAELHLQAAGITDDQLIETMVEHPVLIERPIVFLGERAIVGRPPENVLTLLT